ncbi:MAG: gliding motility-associated ABC transporter substrate-binding protein GldG [Flavobacteriales bacterium]|nr:gliding motility-associated ABC transporter substrate-binding protein GldG [Candidatus Arcticimaribacter sp.]
MFKTSFLRILFVFLGVLLIQILASQSSYRWDLTADKRYSLSPESVAFIKAIEKPIRIDVFLNGKLPQEYQRLRSETEILLQSVVAQNDRFYFEFIDPYKGASNSEQLMDEMSQYGLFPELVVENSNQVTEQSYVFPWMLLNYENRTVRVSLLQKNLGDQPDQRILQSIQQLEFALMDGIHQVLLEEKKKIAVLKSHKTSEDILITSFLQGLLPYYNLASFNLKAFPEAPQKTLENLTRFDLLLVSNPKESFTNTEKFILDQFTQQGGSSMFLIDPVNIQKDSLFNLSGTTVSYGNPLELDDLFFKYGFRIRQELVKDLYSAPIVLAQGSQNNSQYLPYPWPYNPLAAPDQNNPIGSAVGNVFFQFASPIDTLKNNLKKTILINSSSLSKIEGIPSIIELKTATKPIKPSVFTDTAQTLGLTLEGKFNSLYTNRIHPFEWETKEIINARIAVFGDGNLIENQIDKGKPLELGYDKWTNNFYSNKQFFKNTIHYLIGEDNLLSLRSREIKIALLDSEKVKSKGTFWTYFSVFTPLVFLLIIGLFFNWYRNKSYRQ